jgi:uncharacterized protein YbaR (Trm112 family)/SAM-dependent methyltransferase
MEARMGISKAVLDLVRCPVCRGRLHQLVGRLVCDAPACSAEFPILDGIPVLLNESASVFSIQALARQSRVRKLLLERDSAGMGALRQSGVPRALPAVTRRGWNVLGWRNCERFAHLLLSQSAAPRVLVVGGRVLGQGTEYLLSQRNIELVETDVAFGPRTMLICDAHDIPFEDGSFDGVVAQGVLEHVVDPYRCVEEVHRVLKADGLVYAETAFMQQVHGARFDFTRFTDLGHRRLFRRFEELDGGALCGPGMALAWAYRYFLLSFADSRAWRSLVSTFAHLTSFYLMYFDRWLLRRPGAFDAASAVYFMGRRTDHALTDVELITLYRGAQLGKATAQPSTRGTDIRP